jgi:hypothetical protein
MLGQNETPRDDELNGIRGAKVQSWKPANPRDLLKQVIGDNPGSDRRAVLALFRERLREEDTEDYINTIVDYWFANNYYSLVTPGLLPNRDTAASRIRRETRQIAETVKAKIVLGATIVLSEMVMPNGKNLADCTGQECADLAEHLGGWLVRVSRAVKPGERVGDAIDEARLRELFNT